MPIYEYECDKCGHGFEREQRMTDPPVKTCPKCRSRKVTKLISRSSFVLKGGGWYADGYTDAKGKKKGDDGGKEGGAEKSEKKKSADKGGGDGDKGAGKGDSGGKSGDGTPSKASSSGTTARRSAA